MNQKKRIIVMGGGTGGHIFSGLEVANYLKLQGWDVSWLGANNKMEKNLVPKHGIKIECINISGLRGKGIKRFILELFKIIKAIKQAKIIIQNYKPNIVLSMGGYVCGPAGIAARLCHIPIVLHEQNGVAGLTNYCLAKIAKRVLQAFPSAFPNATLVGNPVRETILRLPNPKKRLSDRNGALRILVTGGSQGARILNEELPKVASQVNKKVTIWHQVGKGSKEITEKLYKTLCSKSNNYKVTEFIDDMAEAYSWADIIICRAGALTVSEVSVAGLAAIFVPFQHKDQHQYYNALPLEKIGAAKIIKESQFLTEELVRLLNKWSRSQLLDMANKAQLMAIVDATHRVAKILIEVLSTENQLKNRKTQRTTKLT